MHNIILKAPAEACCLLETVLMAQSVLLRGIGLLATEVMVVKMTIKLAGRHVITQLQETGHVELPLQAKTGSEQKRFKLLVFFHPPVVKCHYCGFCSHTQWASQAVNAHVRGTTDSRAVFCSCGEHTTCPQSSGPHFHWEQSKQFPLEFMTRGNKPQERGM